MRLFPLVIRLLLLNYQIRGRSLIIDNRARHLASQISWRYYSLTFWGLMDWLFLQSSVCSGWGWSHHERNSSGTAFMNKHWEYFLMQYACIIIIIIMKYLNLHKNYKFERTIDLHQNSSISKRDFSQHIQLQSETIHSFPFHWESTQDKCFSYNELLGRFVGCFAVLWIILASCVFLVGTDLRGCFLNFIKQSQSTQQRPSVRGDTQMRGEERIMEALKKKKRPWFWTCAIPSSAVASSFSRKTLTSC